MARRRLIAAIIGLALLSAATPGAAVETSVAGTWINPQGTVKVETGPCGALLCGRIVWASNTAMNDARDSGVDRLIGVELLRDYRKVGPGRYLGTVYVPDMGRSFHSTIEQNGSTILKISGCILDGLICKSQNWRRV